MKCLAFLSLLCYFSYSDCQYSAARRRQGPGPCDNPNKNSLVEHFFNSIFSEFYSSPPLCVCVQMCPGQSTYCYPNGCIKTTAFGTQGATESIPEKTPSQIQKEKDQFILVNGEKYDFMTDFLTRNYEDESKIKALPNTYPQIQNLRPDPFKDKYSILGKYKKAPKVELRYNIQEKAKTTKTDLIKVENLTKSKWPVTKSNKINKHKSMLDVEKPIKTYGKFFTAMLPDSEIAEYPPKYFKRDLSKTVQNDDVNILKAFYVLDNSRPATQSKHFSLETLIENLIRSSFGTNVTIETTPIAEQNEVHNKTKKTIESAASANSAGSDKETHVTSMNTTNKNVANNSYENDTSLINKTGNVHDTIKYLAKQIDLQNNTSMQIAKRAISNFNVSTLKAIDNDDIQRDSMTESISTLATAENSLKRDSQEKTTVSKSTTSTEIVATKKNRQRIVKKFSSKIY